MKSSKAWMLCAVSLLFATAVNAEIEKHAVPADKGMRMFWWPKLQVPAGWQQDIHNSYLYSVNALVQEGESFERAPAVIYAKAAYKPREPKLDSLTSLIASDRGDFEKHVPGVRIEEVDALVTADGQKLRCFTFFPPDESAKDSSWERVAYGEEDDFYLIFTLSAHSRASYMAALGAFEQLVRSYKK